MPGLTIDNPMELQAVLSSQRIIPGDVIRLRGNTYTGNYKIAAFVGTAAQPITIRPYPGEKPIIDGGIELGTGSGDAGSYVTLRNLHILNSDPDRGEWADPNNTTTRLPSLQVMAHHVNLINILAHDGGVGVGHWPSAYGGLLYGLISFNDGWADSNQGGAESLYIQGDAKTIKHCIFGPAFKRSFAAYGSHSAITNSAFLENVIFARQGVLIGSGHAPVIGTEFSRCHIVGSSLRGGYTYDPNVDLTMNDNRIYSMGMAVYNHQFTTLTMLRNVLVGYGSEPNYQAFECGQPADPTGLNWNINQNAYHYLGAANPFGMPTGGFGNFAAWKALGYDAAGTYATTLPAANEIFVYPNEHADAEDDRMGLVVVWNWQGLDSVSVDLSALNLQNGVEYQWRQGQDLLGDTGTFVYNGAALAFDMRAISHTVAKPTGCDEELLPSFFPTFAALVIEKV